ncbi:MAG: tRNA (guanosine(46)-N7)-methyltransferase TrmB [Planctomycetes bacterium]|nr:tRNA (guanosine(46)-N7)-methyltransferase TrmB [Planctomycetota bacterium]
MGANVDISPVTIEQIPLTQDRRYEFRDVFGNDNSVELELGIGKGRFLIQQAQARPDVNFVGVEWAGRYYRLVAERAARRGLENLRVLRDDAAHFIRDTVGNDCIHGLHVYFPDPWPKARHIKRRLVQPWFAREAARVLIDGGVVKLATDHPDYALQMEEVFNSDADFEQIFRAIGDEAPEGVTNWEVKFRAEGRTIHKFEYRRKPRQSA